MTDKTGWTDNFREVAFTAALSEADAHQMLVAAGMRTEDKRPTALAMKNGLGRRRGLGYLAEWHAQKTADCLRTALHQANATTETGTQPPKAPPTRPRKRTA